MKSTNIEDYCKSLSKNKVYNADDVCKAYTDGTKHRDLFYPMSTKKFNGTLEEYKTVWLKWIREFHNLDD